MESRFPPLERSLEVRMRGRTLELRAGLSVCNDANDGQSPSPLPAWPALTPIDTQGLWLHNRALQQLRKVIGSTALPDASSHVDSRP